jgi:hypothetical protein
MNLGDDEISASLDFNDDLPVKKPNVAPTGHIKNDAVSAPIATTSASHSKP